MWKRLIIKTEIRDWPLGHSISHQMQFFRIPSFYPLETVHSTFLITVSILVSWCREYFDRIQGKRLPDRPVQHAHLCFLCRVWFWHFTCHISNVSLFTAYAHPSMTFESSLSHHFCCPLKILSYQLAAPFLSRPCGPGISSRSHPSRRGSCLLEEELTWWGQKGLGLGFREPGFRLCFCLWSSPECCQLC